MCLDVWGQKLIYSMYIIYPSLPPDSDFDGTPITITIPGGLNREVLVEIPIVNDTINEHQETLVGYIEVTSAEDPGTIVIGRSATQLIINDNDGKGDNVLWPLLRIAHW